MHDFKNDRSGLQVQTSELERRLDAAEELVSMLLQGVVDLSQSVLALDCQVSPNEGIISADIQARLLDWSAERNDDSSEGAF